ncbi:MAG TPA: protein-glutamate O-methyltransferase CheR, partial [Thermoleophilia bacterium]|nr:protein-glutamate O-methyltransferase CheR [Thermoleophilia bacterium]
MALSDQQLSALSELIGRWTGLYFPPERHVDLERSLARAAKDFGHAGLGSFVNFLLTTAELTPDQVQTLAWHLTIGETYFLRGRQTFEVLEREVLPEFILARRHDEQQLRIWSAGCAGGEEPYSLAITVSRVLPERQHWNVTILATDINTRALQKANEGVYGSWSFRDTPSWLRPQFFHEVHNGEWEIRPEIKRSVTFSYLNLAADPYPSLATNTNAMDIIFCRNVLMYFSGDTMKRVVDRLHDALREGGYLFVAPSEASHEFFPQFERVATNGEIYYRKNGHQAHAHQHGAAHQPAHGRRPHAAAAHHGPAGVAAAPAAAAPAVAMPDRSADHGRPRPASPAAPASRPRTHRVAAAAVAD